HHRRQRLDGAGRNGSKARLGGDRGLASAGGRMNITFLDEPALEFGGGGRPINNRLRVMGHGPPHRTRGGAPQRIRMGLVGSGETVEGTLSWLDRCKSGVDAKPSRQPNLFPRFPGFSADLGFLSELVTEDQLQRTLPRRAVRELS